MQPPSRRRIANLAWPIILANAASPLLGLADTAVIGNTGTTSELGAIAIGALVFNFVYWSFGFLRMGTTGFVAQALGAGDEVEIRASGFRALLLGAAIAALLLLLRGPIAWLAFELLDASAAVEEVARDYYTIRIWGAPASLATFAMMGVLIGLGLSRHLMWLQLSLNALNITLDVLFAGVMDLGAKGIAWGTAISEWSIGLVAAVVLFRVFRQRQGDSVPFVPWARIWEKEKFAATLSANRDIMIRTVLLLLGFALFTRQGAQFGDAVLAANHLLLQLLSFSAFFLDGFAHVAESLVGQAVGRRDVRVLDVTVERSTQLAAGTAVLLAMMVAFGQPIISALSIQAEVVRAALAYRYFAAIYVFASFAAFQLDGVFIGAGRAKDMRNASVISLGVFVACWWLFAFNPSTTLENAGLWMAFIVYVVTRAVALGMRYPALRALVRDDGLKLADPSGSSR